MESEVTADFPRNRERCLRTYFEWGKSEESITEYVM